MDTAITDDTKALLRKCSVATLSTQLFKRGLRQTVMAIKTALKSKVTTVIDIPINPEEDVIPMVPPGCGLNQQVGDY